MRKDVERARQSRVDAQYLYEEEQRDIVRPLAQMYRENHIGPMLDNLIRRKAERGGNDPGTVRN